MRVLRRLELHRSMDSAPGDVKKMECVETAHERIDLLPASRIYPRSDRNRFACLGVRRKIDAKRSEIGLVRGRKCAIHPNPRLAVDAAEPQPRHLSLPLDRDGHLLPIPAG